MYALNFVIYSAGVPMAKTAILVGIISMIMMQTVSSYSASKINYSQDHVANAAEERIKQNLIDGHLKVKGKATDLADLDGWTAGQSDPYMEVTATAEDGYTQTLTTPTRGGNNNPTWNDNLIFNHRKWEKFTIKIMDSDGAGRDPDQLCPTKEINLESKHSDTVSFNCNPGTATIEYVVAVHSFP